MKKYLSIAFFLMFYLSAHAQDTLIKRDGNKIVAKILEVSAVQVKYKKFNFLDGPTYIDNKSDIEMIIYANGVKDVFKKEVTNSDQGGNDYYSGSSTNNDNNNGGNAIEQYGIRYRFNNEIINDRKLNTILFQSKDKKIISLVGNSKDAKKMEYIGFAAFPFGIASLVFLTESLIHPTYNISNQPQPNTKYLAWSGVCLVGTIACPVISGIYRHKSNTYKRAAIKLYNEKF